MSDTPRTNKESFFPHDSKYHVCDADFARQLERELNDGIDRIKRLLAERDTARLQTDQKHSLREEFRELLGTDDIEVGVAMVRKMKRLAEARLAYINQLEEELMDAKNKHAVLVADVVLNEDRAERIKRLEEAGDAVAAIIGPPGSAHWADENQVDAAWNNWTKAKEAK